MEKINQKRELYLFFNYGGGINDGKQVYIQRVAMTIKNDSFFIVESYPECFETSRIRHSGWFYLSLYGFFLSLR